MRPLVPFEPSQFVHGEFEVDYAPLCWIRGARGRVQQQRMESDDAASLYGARDDRSGLHATAHFGFAKPAPSRRNLPARRVNGASDENSAPTAALGRTRRL